jgi:hypothetical protein
MKRKLVSMKIRFVVLDFSRRAAIAGLLLLFVVTTGDQRGVVPCAQPAARKC